jgi:dihydrofolate reductase
MEVVMGKVVFDISMSLDGFMTAANQTPEEPLGEGGERLHEWAFGDDPADREVFARGAGSLGAVICGWRTYVDSLPFWEADGPTGAARVPVFVVCHEVPGNVPEGGVYSFVTEGIEAARKQAQAAAGDKDVTVMGGADVGRQFIEAGLVDELSIHLVPVLFGGGTRMFEHLGNGQVQLEPLGSVQTAAATHLRFRVAR